MMGLSKKVKGWAGFLAHDLRLFHALSESQVISLGASPFGDQHRSADE
jgi:hypothetical protein